MISFTAQNGASSHCDLPFFVLWSVFLYSTILLDIMISPSVLSHYTEWSTKCHTIDCAHNTFLLL